MKLGTARIAYPQILYGVTVSHYTERKSTTMEWLLLEIARTTETRREYESVPLEQVLSAIFSISDSDILLRQVLIDLVDVGALEQIVGLSDSSEWSQLRCGDLRLTENGRRLQSEGKLPAKSQTNTLEIFYDVASGSLRLASKKDKELPTDTASVKAIEVSGDNLPGFPELQVKELIQNLQQKEKNAPPWLQQNSKVSEISTYKTQIKWQNVSRNILIDEEGALSLQGEPNPDVLRAVLEATDFGSNPASPLPAIQISDLANKKNVQPYDKAGEIISATTQRKEIFFLGAQFADAFERGKKICILLAQPDFSADADTIIKIPSALREGLCYQDTERAIYAAEVEIHFEGITRRVPYVYEAESEFTSNLIELVKEYCPRDASLLKLLSFVDEAPYSTFYTEDFLRQKLNSQEVEEITPVDKFLNRLLKMSRKVSSTLPELSDSNELRRALLKKDRDTLKDLHEWLEQWQTDLETLQKKFSLDLEAIDWRDSDFGKSLAHMNQAAEAVEFFFDDDASTYSKVYVMDTGALMHAPHILDDFTNKTLVVIPELVVDELEDYQDDDDEKAQNDSRRVLRKLEEYSASPWLNLNEETYPELLEDGKEFPLLTVALKFFVKQPVLVTDDAELQNFAKSKGVETITAHELHQQLAGYSTKDKKKTKGKKKNRRGSE